MGLQITEDIAGILITEDPFTLLDNLGKARDLGQLALANVWFPPGAAGAILQPVCLTDQWAAQAGKWRFADWASLDAAKWEEVSRRRSGDWFLQSKGLPVGSVLQSAASVAANSPIFVEFFCFAQPGQNIQDYLIVQFGLYFRLHLHSNGTSDFEDLRQSDGSQILAKGFALTSSGQDLAGKFVQVLILPWRRGRILVYTNQGGSTEIYTGARADGTDTYKSRRTPGETFYYLTTEEGQIQLTPTTETRAYLTANTYVTAGRTGSAQSPVLTVPRSGGVTQGPLLSTLSAEQQDGCRATLTLIYYDESGSVISAPTSNTPAAGVSYKISLTAPDTAHTPQIFGAQIEWERGTGTRQYQSNIIGSPNAARFTMSRDRSQKTFEFELDNPHNAWTSLSDLYNRLIQAQFVADDVDAVTKTVFVGLTDPVSFLDGSASRLTTQCSGLRKHLRSSLLSDSKAFDGMTHCNTVIKILTDGGIDPAAIIVEEDGVTLDQAPMGEDPYWKPANGTSRDEFVQHICDTFSGYVFDDIGGTWYYVSREYFTALALAGTATIPTVYMETPIDPVTNRPVAGAIGPNASIMVALKDSVRKTPEEPRANDIWVVGQDPNTGEILAAHYVDNDSISNRLAPNYVGERRLLIYASASITSLYMAEQACGRMGVRLTQPIVTVSFQLPDFQPDQLPIEGPLYIVGHGLGLVTAFTGDLSNDRWRNTEYTAELL